MSSVEIRPATIDDIEAIQAVGLLTWPPAYLPFTSPDHVLANLNRWWTREAVARSITRSTSLVAVHAGRVVATSTLGTWQDRPVVWKIYVLPDWHGTGLASRLMDATIAQAPPDEDVLIEFVEGNERARRFYERYGFGPDHTEPGEDGTTTVWYRLQRLT